MTINVTTNNVPSEIIDGWQLSAKEREEFDYIDWERIEEGSDSASFFRYRGNLYGLHEFMRTAGSDLATEGWDGYAEDSYFSGLVVKYLSNDEMVIVGRYYAS